MDNVERLTGLMEEKADLEALHDINEEMQENARQGDNTHNNITAAGLQSRRRPPPLFGATGSSSPPLVAAAPVSATNLKKVPNNFT